MELQQFKELLMNENFIAFEQYVQLEIRKAEKSAIASINSDTIDKENAYRAKFYEELINIPRNKVKSE